ncbi:MAG TPA: sigma-70 family RNA polymerase sigma factor [Paracoccaceae bacterium]|nr:sigma-70 family RNA polymerase sigma factor [Paracoccaceae bacterium]
MGRGRTEDEIAVELPRLRRFALVLTDGDAAAADDLVQETLLSALGAVDRFRGGSTLRTWLTSIMLNRVRSDRRREAVRRRWLAREPRDEPLEPASAEERMELRETLGALAALPEEQRVAIALITAGNMSYAEAAEALGVKLGTLMSRVARGRAAMKARLSDVAPGSEEDGR